MMNGQQVRPSRIFYPLIANEVGPAADADILMTIALGRTSCEAERAIIVQGFNDLLEILNRTRRQNEVHVMSSINGVIKDEKLSDDERETEMKNCNELLIEQDESGVRMRRVILIGIFSFWELSLKDICEYYQLNSLMSNKHGHKTESDYLDVIFQDNRPEIIHVISSQIKELRNYMTHGSAGEKRQNVIDELMSVHPEFGISKEHNDYYINSYDGIANILKYVTKGIINAENEAKSIREITKQL